MFILLYLCSYCHGVPYYTTSQHNVHPEVYIVVSPIPGNVSYVLHHCGQLVWSANGPNHSGTYRIEASNTWFCHLVRHVTDVPNTMTPCGTTCAY